MINNVGDCNIESAIWYFASMCTMQWVSPPSHPNFPTAYLCLWFAEAELPERWALLLRAALPKRPRDTCTEIDWVRCLQIWSGVLSSRWPRWQLWAQWTVMRWGEIWHHCISHGGGGGRTRTFEGMLAPGGVKKTADGLQWRKHLMDVPYGGDPFQDHKEGGQTLRDLYSEDVSPAASDCFCYSYTFLADFIETLQNDCMTMWFDKLIYHNLIC